MEVRAQVDQTKQRKLNFEYWNPRKNASIMYLLIQLLKEQPSLFLTQLLFHSPTTSNHAPLRLEDTIILQFCVALAM